MSNILPFLEKKKEKKNIDLLELFCLYTVEQFQDQAAVISVQSVALR